MVRQTQLSCNKNDQPMQCILMVPQQHLEVIVDPQLRGTRPAVCCAMRAIHSCCSKAAVIIKQQWGPPSKGWSAVVQILAGTT